MSIPTKDGFRQYVLVAVPLCESMNQESRHSCCYSSERCRRELRLRTSLLHNSKGVCSSTQSRNRKIPVSTLAPSSNLEEKTENNYELSIGSSEIFKVMEDAFIKSLGNSTIIRRCVYELVRVAIELQNLIGEIGQVHCFLSCNSKDPVILIENKNLFPTASKQYHSNLMINNIGASIAAQEIHEGFRMSRKDCHDHLQSSAKETAAIMEIKLPAWLLWLAPETATSTRGPNFTAS